MASIFFSGAKESIDYNQRSVSRFSFRCVYQDRNLHEGKEEKDDDLKENTVGVNERERMWTD